MNIAEKVGSFESAVKVRCANLSCDWSIVWHSFGGYFPKDIKCEECDGEVLITAARRNDICRLGLNRGEYAIPESQRSHHIKNGILRKKDIF